MGGQYSPGGGQYSPVNTVRGDTIHGGTLFTPTAVLTCGRDTTTTPQMRSGSGLRKSSHQGGGGGGGGAAAPLAPPLLPMSLMFQALSYALNVFDTHLHLEMTMHGLKLCSYVSLILIHYLHSIIITVICQSLIGGHGVSYQVEGVNFDFRPGLGFI